MIIAKVANHTRIVGKSQGYLGLPIRDERIECAVNGPGTPRMVSAWEPTPEELERLNRGANVEVKIPGTVVPPMLVEVGEVSEDV